LIKRVHVISQETVLIKSTHDQLVPLIFFTDGYFVPITTQHPYVVVKLLAQTALLRGDNTCLVKYGLCLLLWELRKQRWLNLFCWSNCCGKLPPSMQLESTVLWSHVRAWRRKLCVRQKANEGKKNGRCSTLRCATQLYRSELSE